MTLIRSRIVPVLLSCYVMYYCDIATLDLNAGLTGLLSGFTVMHDYRNSYELYLGTEK